MKFNDLSELIKQIKKQNKISKTHVTKTRNKFNPKNEPISAVRPVYTELSS